MTLSDQLSDLSTTKAVALNRRKLKTGLTIRVFGIQLTLRCPTPRQRVIAAPIWHSIIPDAHDLVFCVHDAGSDLQGDMPQNW